MYNIHFFVPEHYAECPEKEEFKVSKEAHCDLTSSKKPDNFTSLASEGWAEERGQESAPIGIWDCFAHGHKESHKQQELVTTLRAA